MFKANFSCTFSNKESRKKNEQMLNFKYLCISISLPHYALNRVNISSTSKKIVKITIQKQPSRVAKISKIKSKFAMITVFSFYYMIFVPVG